MKIQQKKYTPASGWETLRNELSSNHPPQLVLAFGNRALISKPLFYAELQSEYPAASILIASTSGEITGTQVSDESVSLTAIWLEKTKIETAAVQVSAAKSSFDAGAELAQALEPSGLKNVLVISDGQLVNGSELVKGMQEALPADAVLTGGLAGDGAAFEKTLVGLNEQALEGRIAAIGFYGDALKVTFGSAGGWDSFGPERLITRSKGNILYELDDKPALDVYKMYLGEYANELPGAGLLFPLCIRSNGSGNSLVRTILAVSEEEKSLTFAGNMPEGTYARLMKSSPDRLIEGAAQAAKNSIDKKQEPELAILISCVGRKLVLDQRTEEEVEAVHAIYGGKTAIMGFYSYGEICPARNFVQCDLHNQTMTITTFSEAQ